VKVGGAGTVEKRGEKSQTKASRQKTKEPKAPRLVGRRGEVKSERRENAFFPIIITRVGENSHETRRESTITARRLLTKQGREDLAVDRKKASTGGVGRYQGRYDFSLQMSEGGGSTRLTQNRGVRRSRVEGLRQHGKITLKPLSGGDVWGKMTQEPQGLGRDREAA